MSLRGSNAVVTPLRKAASYEQRKTNLGQEIYYIRHVYRRHDSRLESADFTWQNFQKASRRPRNYHVLPRRCRICHELATYMYHPKSLKWLYVAHTRRELRKGVTTALYTGQLYVKVGPGAGLGITM